MQEVRKKMAARETLAAAHARVQAWAGGAAPDDDDDIQVCAARTCASVHAVCLLSAAPVATLAVPATASVRFTVAGSETALTVSAVSLTALTNTFNSHPV